MLSSVQLVDRGSATSTVIDRMRARWRALSRSERALLALFLLTLPFLNPAVRGDGVGYYAYLRSLLIEGRFDFREDWLAAPAIVRIDYVDEAGNVRPEQFTRTGVLVNHWSIGPALLWAPAVVTVHVVVLGARALGARVPADGLSWPYMIAMAV